MAAPAISAIVVNYRRPDILGACLNSLRAALFATTVVYGRLSADNEPSSSWWTTPRAITRAP